MAAPAPLDPLDSLLDPINPAPATRTMATLGPITTPITDEPETPEVSTSAAAPTTQAPSPSPTPVTSSAVVPTTSSAAPTTASPSPIPSTSTEVEEPSTSSTIPSSSAAPSSTSTSTSTTPSSTSTVESTSTSSSTSTSTSTSATSSSSSSQAGVTITSTVSREQPGLVTSVSPVSRTSSVSGAAASSTGKGGIGGSGLPLGGLVGIIIGGIIALCLIALVVTRQIRKKARSRRTAHRTSMFEPWPAPVTLEDEDDLEKSRYSPPSQAYPMQNTGQYDYETYDAYGQAGVGAGAGAAAGAAAATYPPSGSQYPNQDYGYQGQQGADYNAQQPNDAATAGTASAAAAAMGLRDGMMVMVSVGFVRSLEDELAVAPGQQLWLHTAYDDGWTLCEDQNQNRGVVPLTCIEPWTEDSNHLSALPRSNTAESLSATSERRSSLYQNAQAGAAYLNAPGAGH